jgi:hypothetical protein
MNAPPPHRPESTPPEVDTRYFFPHMEDPDLVAWAIWTGCKYDEMMLGRGQVFLEEAHALAWAGWIVDVMGGG